MPPTPKKSGKERERSSSRLAAKPYGTPTFKAGPSTASTPQSDTRINTRNHVPATPSRLGKSYTASKVKIGEEAHDGTEDKEGDEDGPEGVYMLKFKPKEEKKVVIVYEGKAGPSHIVCELLHALNYHPPASGGREGINAEMNES